jgi:hypothetical protein
VISDLDGTSIGPGELVELLGDPHRRVVAFRELLALGSGARSAAIDGLRSPNARVREQCCRLLDHITDADGTEALLDVLDDPDPQVRAQAIHALACDRCKDDECRIDASAVLPKAITMLANDESRWVRNFAVELVGVWVHTHPEAVAALERAARTDPSSAVRKKATWYAPGGAVFTRTVPKPPRVMQTH